MKRDLNESGLGRQRVLAAMVRLLDVGLFRIGGEAYAAANSTFGISSLQKEHVTIRSGVMAFVYPAKGSAERRIEIDDPDAGRVVTVLLRRRTGGPHLFAYKRGRQWVKVHSKDVNDYIKDAAGKGFSAKDFRTWSATVLAAAGLAEQAPAPSTKKGTARRYQPGGQRGSPSAGGHSRRKPPLVYRSPRSGAVRGRPHHQQELARRARRRDGPHPGVEEVVVEIIGAHVSS